MSSISNVIEFPRRPEHDEQFGSRQVLLEERQRLARELHDVVSHGLATISVNAGAALQILDEQPQQAAEALAAIKTASKEALHELRVILGMLRTDHVDVRLSTPGLGRLAALVANTTAAGVPTEVRIVGRPRPLPVAVDIAAFRIVQESLTNVLRHAGHASVCVTVAYERHGLTLEIEDDGDGVAGPDQAGVGHGIVGMRDRVDTLGGELSAGARPEGGFRVRAWLPVLLRP